MNKQLFSKVKMHLIQSTENIHVHTQIYSNERNTSCDLNFLAIKLARMQRHKHFQKHCLW